MTSPLLNQSFDNVVLVKAESAEAIKSSYLNYSAASMVFEQVNRRQVCLSMTPPVEPGRR